MGYDNGDFQENNQGGNQGGGHDQQGGGYQRKSWNGGGNNGGGYNGNGGGYRGNGGGNPYPRRDNGGGGGGYRGGGGGYRGGGGGGYRNNNAPPRDFNTDPPIFYKPYVGTGNQDTPEDVLVKMREVRDLLDANGFTARTSGFDGPDTKCFAQAKRLELLLPWRGFNQMESKHSFTSDEAKFLAAKHFPNFEAQKDATKTFMGKNVRLIQGQNLHSNAIFVITWSADGCERAKDKTPQTGFTAHLIAIANECYVPVFNFGRPDAKERLLRYLSLDTTQGPSP